MGTWAVNDLTVFLLSSRSEDDAKSRLVNVEDALKNESILKDIISKPGSLKISNIGPSNVDCSSIFYVNMAESSWIGDIAADGAGMWKNEGRFTWEYRLDGDGYRCVKRRIRQRQKREDLPSDIYRLVKIYYRHKSHNVKRYIVYIETERMSVCQSIVVVGYCFEGTETRLCPDKPHGNAKNSMNSYTTVRPMAVQHVASLTQSMSLTRALENHITEQGGRAIIPSEMRPNKRQIHTQIGTRTKVTGDDDLQAMMAYAADNPTIVRAVCAHPEPYIILATNQQLADMDRFCKGLCETYLLIISNTFIYNLTKGKCWA